MRLLNESAIREHALECSKRYKNGRFTRVSEAFINEVTTEVEAIIREFHARWGNNLVFEPLSPVNGTRFVTGAMLDKLHEALDISIAKLIQRKVERQPSMGKTIDRTH